MSLIIYWISVLSAFYLGYCFALQKLVFPKIQIPRISLNRKKFQYSNDHLSSCTCVGCVNNRLKERGYIK